jgi:hypothetical protein
VKATFILTDNRTIRPSVRLSAHPSAQSGIVTQRVNTTTKSDSSDICCIVYYSSSCTRCALHVNDVLLFTVLGHAEVQCLY